MPTDEELQAAVAKAVEEAKAEAEARIKAASNGKFTQEDLDRIAGESRASGRTSAEKDLLKKFGVENLEAIESVIKAAREQEESQKTELQKAQDEAARLRQEAETAKVEARNARIEAALDSALRASGLNPERVHAAKRLVDTSALEIEGSDVKGLDEVVKAVRETSPEWFVRSGAAVDASKPATGPIDFRTATKEERDKALASYNIRV